MPRTPDPLPIIDPTSCTGCALCIDLCPTNALGQVDGRSSLVVPEACTYCMVCQDVCPEDAITLPFLIVFGNESG
jgi:formate hydrogenlyase subunit 6/NADH:ubiquinone oxidoreductase subunit I